jgi:hypothetical protein
MASSAALLAAFLTIERRSVSPLIRLGILRKRALSQANVIAMGMIDQEAVALAEFGL